MTLDDLTLHHIQYACAEVKPPSNQPNNQPNHQKRHTLFVRTRTLYNVHSRQFRFLPVECRRVRVNKNVKSFYDRNEN